MSVINNTGVACECSRCEGPQWYDSGLCLGCSTDLGITYTWRSSHFYSF